MKLGKMYEETGVAAEAVSVNHPVVGFHDRAANTEPKAKRMVFRLCGEEGPE